MLRKIFIVLLFLTSFNGRVKADPPTYVTQTVYGFLDFTTTIANTVMIFSPKSTEPAAPATTEIPQPTTTSESSILKTSSSSQIIVNTVAEINTAQIKPTQTIEQMPSEKVVLSSTVQVIKSSPVVQEVQPIKVVSSKVEIVTSVVESKPENDKSDKLENEDDDEVIQIGNNLGEPEYNFLSRQPSEFVEETYKITNLSPSSKSPQQNQAKSRHPSNQKRAQSPSRDSLPTGLVTKLGGTVVKDGVTTVHETSVIGTFISGKYAQVLQSSSHIYQKPKQKIAPSSTLRILKTAAPLNRHQNEPSHVENPTTHSTPEHHNRNSLKRVNTPNGSFKNRFKKPAAREESDDERYEPPTTPRTTPAPTQRKNTQRSRAKPKNKRTKNRTSSSLRPATTASSSTDGYSRRVFKPKVQPSVVEPTPSEQTSLYKFKLNRSPGRWQYKTSPKPRVTIRKQNNNPEDQSIAPGNSEILTNDIPTGNSNLRNTDVDLDQSGSVNGGVVNNLDTNNEKPDKRLIVETLNVEISTPADFKDTYFEIATIKTPYTFQVGTIKNTRYITITSTFEKTLDPEPTATSTLTGPLTENILAPSAQQLPDQNLLETSIATLSPLYLQSEGETPPLETSVETFSTTQNILKTHILPVIYNTNTTSLTLVQTYHITRFVTATKTLPPLDAYQFIPSKRLKEFNSKLDEAGSELHLELEFGDEDENDEDRLPVRVLPEKDIEEVGADLDLIDFKNSQLEQTQNRRKTHKKPQKEQFSPNPQNVQDQLQQLALLRLLNPAAAQLPQVITTSKPVIKLETVYESHVIPIFNGQTTSLSTISRPVGTVSKTEYEYGTSTIPAFQQPIPQIPQIQPVNPLFQQQAFQITTAPIITQTILTQTQSKVLKLTFGAKTAYTTIYSTNVVPTMLTTFITTSVQPTAAGFPGYYQPFAPYPYVG